MILSNLHTSLEKLPPSDSKSFVTVMVGCLEKTRDELVRTSPDVRDRNLLVKAAMYTSLFPALTQHGVVNPNSMKAQKVVSKLENLIPTLKPYVDEKDDFI